MLIARFISLIRSSFSTVRVHYVTTLFKTLCLIILNMLAVSFPAFAQNTSGSITGVVQDAMTPALDAELRAVPRYNIQHSIRPIPKELFDKLSTPPRVWIFQ
jgi:hypothetical protein